VCRNRCCAKPSLKIDRPVLECEECIQVLFGMDGAILVTPHCAFWPRSVRTASYQVLYARNP